PTRDADGEALDCAREGPAATRLDDQMDVVGLDRELGEADAEAFLRGIQALKDDAARLPGPQAGNPLAHPHRHVDGRAVREALPSHVRYACLRPLGFPSRSRALSPASRDGPHLGIRLHDASRLPGGYQAGPTVPPFRPGSNRRTSPARPPSVGGGGPGEGQPMPAALARSASGSVGSVAVSGAVEGSVEAPATLSEVSAAPAPTSF